MTTFSINLSSLNGTNGFRLDGETGRDYSGTSVSTAGDVNGDGFDDVIVGARHADPNGDDSGSSYVIFGKTSGFSAEMNLSSLNGSNGFRLDGEAVRDFSGHSVSTAGDVNGDGFDDVIVGAHGSDPNGNSVAGSSYVVFGKASGFSAEMNLSSLNGSNGFRLDGEAVRDFSGHSVSTAGDVNGDGFDDVIVGALFADPNGSYSGASYVVFGKASGFSAAMDLSSLNGSNGFRLDGKAVHDFLGTSVSAAGDVNGDGFDDVIVGARGAAPNGISSGSSYVVFGRGSFAAPVIQNSTPGDDILTGTTSDNNTVTYASSTASVAVSLLLTTQQNTIGAGLDTITQIENLIGSKFSDILTGDTKHNVLDGRGGNDTLIGWSGADIMIGGWGSDTYFVENLGDEVIEKLNQGADTVSSKITYALPANVENFILTGKLAINGSGNNQANVITGNNAANELNGREGNDTINGRGGNDTLIGWSGADIMIGGWGSDTYFVENLGDEVIEKLNQGADTVSSKITYALPANVENLILTGKLAIDGTGNNKANMIFGNKAANVLDGGAGNDTINGGTGNNVLTGDNGKDIFQFTTKGHIDAITDYSVLNDTIELDNAVFSALTATGTLAASHFRTGWKALDGDDFIIYNNAKSKLLYDADGDGPGAATTIATVGVGLSMTHADIVVI